MSFLTHTFNLVFNPSFPRGYPRRFSDWLEKPLSQRVINHPSDYFIGTVLDKVFKKLSETPIFSKMLDECTDLEDVPVILTKRKSRLDSEGGCYDVSDNMILVDFKMRRRNHFFISDHLILEILAHEYRHAFQYLNRLRGKRPLYMDDGGLAEELIGEADAVAYEAGICFQAGGSSFYSKQWLLFQINHPIQSKAFKKEFNKSKDINLAMSETAKSWFEDTKRVNFYTQKHKKSIERQADQFDDPYKSAIRKLVQEEFEEWLANQPIMISNRPAEVLNGTTVHQNKKNAECSLDREFISSVLNLDKLKTHGVDYFIRNVDPRTLTQLHQAIKDYSENRKASDKIYRRLKERGFSTQVFS